MHEFTDEELKARAEASSGRVEAPTGSRPITADVGLKDVLRAAEAARLASEAAHAATPPPTDVQQRWLQLRGVLDQLPPGALRATRQQLEARITPAILREVLKWQWGSGNLILMGRTRAGKTSGAAHLVRRLCSEAAKNGGRDFELAQMIRWQSCRELSEAARETRLGTGTPEAIVRCKYARLLVLNDLGIEDDRKTIERIIDERNERMYPTITTTGLRRKGKDSLEGLLGDALASRFYECGADKGTFVEVWT